MCLTAFAKHVTPSSPSFSCLQLAMLFWSLSRAHPCCWVCSFTSLWVRSFLPAVEPLLSVLCRSFSLDLRLLCLCVSNPLFLSLTLLASCLWDRPVTVMFTLFVGFVQVLVGCCSFTPLFVRHVLLVVLVANCSPTHVLTPSTPSRAARGLLI